MSFAMQFDMRCHSPATEEADRQVENAGDEILGGEHISLLNTTINDNSHAIAGNNDVCSLTRATFTTCAKSKPSGFSFDCCEAKKPQCLNGSSPFISQTDILATRSKRDGNGSNHSLQSFDDTSNGNYSSGLGVGAWTPGADNRPGASCGAVTQTYAANGMRKRHAMHNDDRRSEHIIIGKGLQSFVDMRYKSATMPTEDDSFYRSYISNEDLINPESFDGSRQVHDTLLADQSDKSELKRKRRAQEFEMFCCPNPPQFHQITLKEEGSIRLSGQPTVEPNSMSLIQRCNLNALQNTPFSSNSNQFCAPINCLPSMDASSCHAESNVHSEVNGPTNSSVESVQSRLWPCTSAKLMRVLTDPSLKTSLNSSHTYDDADLQLPRSVINKLVKDAAGRIRVSAEAREVFVSCCHEFVKVLGALANLSCEENKKKLIGPDHVMAALTEMALEPFRPACLEIMNTLQEEAAQKRKRMTLCYDGDDFTTDKLLKEQQKLFEQARKEQFMHDQDVDDCDSSDESSKDGRRVEINGVSYRIPTLQPVERPFPEEDDDYD